jgi:hypothetical protein
MEVAADGVGLVDEEHTAERLLDQLGRLDRRLAGPAGD